MSLLHHFVWTKQPCMRRNLCSMLPYLFCLLGFLSGAGTQRLFTASPLRENCEAYRNTVVTLPKEQPKHNSVQILYQNQMLGMRSVGEFSGPPWLIEVEAVKKTSFKAMKEKHSETHSHLGIFFRKMWPDNSLLWAVKKYVLVLSINNIYHNCA